MHLVGNRRSVVEVVLFLQVQRVHVGAQADRLLAGPRALEGADHTGGGEAAMNLDAPRGELVGNDLRRARLLEGGLGMTMDVAADGGQLGGEAGQTVGSYVAHGPGD
jgi:hypothetical protein